MAEVTEMPPQETAETADLTSPETPEQAASAPKRGRGRPEGSKSRPTEVKQPQFFDRVFSVPDEDWGTRAFMYVYAEEPVCNKKTFGETRYILKSSRPILDFEGLKQDYGSFKGWMSLNLRKTGKDATDEVDRLNFEIYDPKHPPKIPRSAWANDDRNKRWADLLPPEQAPASAAASSLIEGARFYKEIRDEVKSENAPAEQPANSTKETLETMKLAKELFAAPVAAPAPAASDPFDVAAKIMAMRANDPMVTIMSARLDSMDKALSEAREREFKLQQQLLEKAATPQVQPKGAFDQILELVSDDTKLDKVKKVFGLFGGGENGTAVRSRMNGSMELASDIITKVLDSPIATGVNVWLQAKAAQIPQSNPAAVQSSQNGTIQVPNTEQQLAVFIEQTLNPSMLTYYENEEPGTEFAEWLWAGFPDRLQELQNFRHPAWPGLQGEAAILAGYKHSPQIWPRLLKRGEQAFVQFIREFCNWKPPADEDEAIPVTATHDEEERERIS